MIKAVLVEELAARFMMPKREAAIVVHAIVGFYLGRGLKRAPHTQHPKNRLE